MVKTLHVLEAMGGGTRRHVLDLLPALAARGVGCTLAVSPHRNWPARETFEADVKFLRAHDVAVEIIEMPRAVSLRSLRELSSLVRRTRPNIVHAHSSIAGAYARLARLSSPRTALIYTPHCIAFETGLPRRQRRAARWAEQLLAPFCTRYIAVSGAEQQAIARVLRRNASVIFNGIDLQDFDAIAPHQRRDWNLGKSDFVIGCFGRLSAQKNQASLVRAFEEIYSEFPHAKLLLVGDGEDRAQLEEYGRNRPYFGSIIFAGEHAEARGFYALCDVVVQPSRWEGCPYSVLEAMAARKPVIARDVGGVPEILGDTGSTYHRADELVPLLCHAIVSAAARAASGQAARTRIEAEFTLDKMIEKTLAAYRSAASCNRL